MSDQYVPQNAEGPVQSKFQLSSAQYDALKWIAQIFLPALGALYFTIAAIWGLPFAEQIVGSITAVDAFLGILLGISTKSYWANTDNKAGILRIDTTDPETDKYGLEIHAPLSTLPNKSAVTFRVISS